MQKNRAAKTLAVAAQLVIFMAPAGLSRAQGPAPQSMQHSAPSQAQRDPYAEAFAGLTYTDKQKEAIIKIRQDTESRRAAVRKDDKLTQEQKDAMLSGYVRIEYTLIYKELTPEQKKEVSTRMRAHSAANQPAQKAHATPR